MVDALVNSYFMLLWPPLAIPIQDLSSLSFIAAGRW